MFVFSSRLLLKDLNITVNEEKYAQENTGV